MSNSVPHEQRRDEATATTPSLPECEAGLGTSADAGPTSAPGFDL